MAILSGVFRRHKNAVIDYNLLQKGAHMKVWITEDIEVVYELETGENLLEDRCY